jgi:phospholipid/cholesterol/gamma-HCH transport system permease protein
MFAGSRERQRCYGVFMTSSNAGIPPGAMAGPWVQRAARLGAGVRHGFAQLGSVSWLFGKCFQALFRLSREQFRVVLEVTRIQIRFTALDALPLCVVMALMLGAITLLQVFGQLSGYGVESTLSGLLAQLVIRELGPLLVGILVIIRSGTAMATEMASRKLSGELDALWVSGVDPVGYLLVPRILGGIVSVFALVILFDAVALLGGFLVAWLRLPLSFSFFLGALGQAIGHRELLATFSKCLVFGAAIPLLCTSYGLRVRRSTTEIPQAVTRAAVASLLVLVLAGALLSVLIYA